MTPEGWGGIPVVVSEALPITPTAEQDIVRMVRHGLADVLEWLGEDVGPRPGVLTHAFKAGDKLFVSQEFFAHLRGLRKL